MALIIIFALMLAGKPFKQIQISIPEKQPKAFGGVTWIGSTRQPVVTHRSAVDDSAK
jgi:hypothetical protein